MWITSSWVYLPHLRLSTKPTQFQPTTSHFDRSKRWILDERIGTTPSRTLHLATTLMYQHDATQSTPLRTFEYAYTRYFSE
jgi:hypothetical protein